MSFLDTLSHLSRNVGRGALDVFTLGGNELGHKFGGQGYSHLLKPIETGFGANFEAGAAGGSGMLGAQGLGAFGAGGGGASGMSAPNMGASGSTLGAGGASSPLSLGGYGSSGGMASSAGGTSGISQALNLMRMMPQGSGQGQMGPQQGDVLQKIYQMFPSLRPFSSMGQGANIGGMPRG